MRQSLRWYDAITINIYYTGLTALSQTMTPLVLPLLVQQFVGEQQQGTYYGTIRLWSLMVALLVQSLMGMLSDRSTSRFGRRRPFIFIGSLAVSIIIVLIGFTAGMEGITGFWVLFALVLLMMVAVNTAHGAVQGLIPDLVPESQRGIFSGVKSLLEVPVPLILVPFTIGHAIGAGNLWAGLAILIGIILFTMLTTMLAPEIPLQIAPPQWNWEPFIRLLSMTAVFTLVILGIGSLIKFLSNILTNFQLTPALLIMGALGITGILLAVIIGVYFSIQIGLGRASKQDRSFTWWVINRLAFLVGSVNISSFVVYFLQGRFSLQRELAVGPATRLIMMVGIFILLLSLPSGWLSDRFGRKWMVAGSGFLAGLGSLVIILAPNMFVIYLGAILVGSAAGIFYTANWALGTEIVPKDEAGRFLGISNLAGAGAGAIGAYIGGPIADYFSVNFANIPGIGYVLLFSIYGILFLISIFAVFQVTLPGQKILNTNP